MIFNYKEVDTLPNLAWCAVFEKGSETVNIYHGLWVETKHGFFVEGAWDGDFQLGEFDNANAFMGTGGKVSTNGNILLSTPCHIHERLHLVRVGEKLFVSPSLAFVLTASGTSLDINYIPYQVDLLKMISSIENHIGSIPADGGRQIDIYHYRNIEIDLELHVIVQEKIAHTAFKDFREYKEYLISCLTKLRDNANSDERNIKYKLISMMSSGYDSPACTALGTAVGLEEVLTFRSARAESGVAENTDDSGTEIARVMGLRVKEFDRLDVLRSKELPEAEFVASGDLGQDFEISVLGNDLSQRLLIVGYHGDTMWNVLKKDVKKDIPRGDAGGCCWLDFKWRVGYVFVPVPYIGCMSHPSIHKISNSKEMEKWRTWNKYDRPIARRLVEDEGVPRHLFGQSKKAISILLNHDKSMLKRMSHESVKSFQLYYEAHKKKRNQIMQIYYDIMHMCYMLHYKMFSRLNDGLQRFNMPMRIPCPISDKFSQPTGRPSFLVHWGISRIERRYKT